jgi:hypothetical protein
LESWEPSQHLLTDTEEEEEEEEEEKEEEEEEKTVPRWPQLLFSRISLRKSSREFCQFKLQVKV